MIFERLRRLIMDIFRVAEDILPKDINKEYYEHIELWDNVYKGFVEDWHQQTYTSVNGETQTEEIKRLNAAKMICAETASLIFGEKTEIVIDKEKTKAFVDAVLEDNGFSANQLDMYEYMLALGGACNKLYRKDDKIKIGYVTASRFIPLKYGKNHISAAAFVTDTQKGDRTYSLVETYEHKDNKVRVTAKLYKRRSNTLDKGVQVPLGTDGMYEGMDEEVILDNMSTPLFSYVKTAIANNLDKDTPLGISLYANSLDALQSCDKAYHQYDQEVWHSGNKSVVSASAIEKRDTDGTVSYTVDPKQKYYQALNFSEDMFENITPPLRVDGYIGAINADLDIISAQIGMSQGFISFDSKSGLKTATEVINENSRTYRTANKFKTSIERNIRQLVQGIVDLGISYGDITKEDYTLTIQFDDSIIADKDKQQLNDKQEVTMGIMQAWEYRVKWYGETEEEAKKALGSEDVVEEE